MKRKAVIFVLIFTLLIANALAGCGSGPDTDNSGDASSSVSSGSPGGNAEDGGAADDSETEPDQVIPDDSGPAQNSGAIPDTTESAASDWGVASAAGSSDPDAPGGASNTESGITEGMTDISQVIADRDDLFFAIKEVSADASLGYTWKVYIENRTDKNLMFSFEKVSVDGVMCDPYWAEVVAAGKKGNCEIIWMRDALEERQITEVTQVDFTLNVYNDDDYTEAPLIHDPFTVYPLGEGAASSGPVPREIAETDIVLVDNDDCRIVVTGFDPGNSWGYAVNVYLFNKTGEDLIFSAENTSVNGIMCDPYWAEIVTAGKAAVSTILWDTAALSEKGISEVKEISLPVRVCSDKDVANPYVEESFELRP